MLHEIEEPRGLPQGFFDPIGICIFAEDGSKVIYSVEFDSVVLRAFSVTLCVTRIYKIAQSFTEDSQRFTEVF